MYIESSPSFSKENPSETLPTMYDLPSESPEDPGLPDEFHIWQPRILCDTCCPPNYPSDRVLVATDLNIYYDLNHLNWYKRPDWFVSVGIDRFYQQRDLRLSYVMWQEKVSPLVMVELISPGTEDDDFGLTKAKPHHPPTKWYVYERILKVPYYIVFNRYNNDELRVFRLVGNRYKEQVLTEPRFWIPEIELGLGLWFGKYYQFHRNWLRWYDANSQWIPLPEELEALAKEQAQQAQLEAQQAQLEAQQAQLEAQQARREVEAERVAKQSALERAERLAEHLKSLGINPDEL